MPGLKNFASHIFFLKKLLRIILHHIKKETKKKEDIAQETENPTQRRQNGNSQGTPNWVAGLNSLKQKDGGCQEDCLEKLIW